MAFGKAFSAARKAGKKEFTYRGKRYNTKLAGETPSRAPTPSAAPRGSSGSPSRSNAKAAPTPTPRPSRTPANTMRSGRAIGGPDAPEHRAPKVAKRADPKAPKGPNYGIARPNSPMGRAIAARHNAPKSGNRLAGGSIMGGFIKWGDQVKQRPAYRNPSPRAR